MTETAGTIELKFNAESGKFEKAELEAAPTGELERNVITDLPLIPAAGGLVIAGLGDIASGMITDAIFPTVEGEPPSDTKTLTDAGILVGLAIIPQFPQVKRVAPGIANATSLILLADAITKVIDIRGLISGFGDPDPGGARAVNNRWLLSFGRRGPRRRGRGDGRRRVVTNRRGSGRVVEMNTSHLTQVGAGGGRGAGRVLGGGLGAPTMPVFPVQRDSRAELVGL